MMVTWFAGLFYLPRLFIYHAETADAAGRARFSTMEKRLFAIMTIGATVTVALGLTLVVFNPGIAEAPWFLIKFGLVLGQIAYHYRCWQWIRRLENETRVRTTDWLRWYNEIPVVFLLGIVLLAVAKPF